MNININVEAVKDTVESALYHQPRKTDEELREFISGISSLSNYDLSDDEIEHIARSIEHSQGIKVDFGAVVDSEEYTPWLDDVKSSINPYYWERYRKLLIKKGFPKEVVISTGRVTDTILGRLENPEKDGKWDRRGMVVGHVQSGKTANYTGLVC